MGSLPQVMDPYMDHIGLFEALRQLQDMPSRRSTEACHCSI